jgi:hypothetical protein
MRLDRLRAGELTTLVGAAGLLVVMFLHWFRADVVRIQVIGHGGPPEATGWGSLGWFAAALIALAILVALTSVVLALKEESPALPLAGEVLTCVLGLAATLAIAFRLVFQPGLDVGAPDPYVTILGPAWLGLLFAAVLTAGGWIALKDERTDAPPSPQPDVELRPIPPPS